MQQEHRLVLALALSALVLFLARMYMTPEPQSVPEPVKKEEISKETASIERPVVAAEKAKESGSSGPESPTPVAATQAPERTIAIQDPKYRIVLQSHGARIESWKYKERSGNEMELVLQDKPKDLYGPLAVIGGDASVQDKINNAIYEIRVVGQQGDSLKTPVELECFYQEGPLKISKKMGFAESSFVVETITEVEYQGKRLEGLKLRIGPAMGAFDTLLNKATWDTQGLAYYSNGSLNKLQYSAIETEQTMEGSIPWAGIQDQYFAMLAISPEGKSLHGGKILSWKYKGKDIQEKETEFNVGAIDIPLFQGEKQRIYFGPKEDQQLKSIHPALDQVIDYGWFRILVEPMLYALRWIHSLTPNYGVAIIIMTFLITLVLFPLRFKQIISMKKMQKIQPQMKAIQERYKKAKSSAEDRQKMNTEMMALYKQHGVNPVGGCLPLLIQFPFLIAVYNLVGNHFNLRGAPFLLWIQNLAAPDPYYVTPIVMGITMFLSMKLTTPPTAGDPMQNKMMAWMMPGMMTFFFLGMSAGLNVYFLFSNIFSIALQKAAERYIPALKNA